MKNKNLLTFITLLLFAKIISAQSLLHYWNFNATISFSAHVAPTSSVISGAALDTLRFSGGISLVDVANGTGQGFDISNFNARNSDLAGNHLRFNNPIYGALIFSLPTTGYKDIIVKYAGMRSGSGAFFQFIHYTTDGTNYKLFDTIRPTTAPTLYTFNFTDSANVKDNANFKVRITFGQGGGGLAGNNRIDNFTMEGVSNVGADLIAPNIVFAPVNNQQLVGINVVPTLTFSEDVRLINNTAIGNADSLIIFKLNDSAGTNVSFTTSFSGRILTITPTISLLNNQTYYLALKENRIEDLANNALVGLQRASFKTISFQTPLNMGDIVPVAFRMNALTTDDGVAFLTFKSIAEGTIINLTDAKYTDNMQAQCNGGLQWTAPTGGIAAGTVVAINLGAVTANLGALSGSSFGLSSGGDQVIFYTQTASNPNFLTALSSNAWVASNISCSGSLSKIPLGLADGINAINLSSSPGNVAGNSVNAYYIGTQTGDNASLKTAILNPNNWIAVDAGAAAQMWPIWAFPGPPSVVKAEVVNNVTLRVIFNKDLDNTSASTLANYAGIANLASVTRTNNGILADTITLVYSSIFSTNGNFTLTVSNVKDNDNLTMFAPFSFNFSYIPNIKWSKNFVVFNEDAGTVTLNLILQNPASTGVSASLKGGFFKTATSADHGFTFKESAFNGNSSSNQTITFNINDDNISESDEYFSIELINPTGGLVIDGDPLVTVYIRDNDRKALVATKAISLNPVKSYDPNPTVGSTTEIVVYDSASKQLFMTSAVQDRMDIVNFSNPINPILIKSVAMASYGGITSVAVYNGLVAVASPNANEQLDGQVVFFNTSGDFLKKVTVGALPDNISFTPDGKKVLTANEGQPSIDYTLDPEGSVSIIDVSGGIANVSQNSVTTLLFTAFNSQEAALIASGVRKTKVSSTLSQDLEPEYITTSADSKKAWVVLQENNSIAEIDLTAKTFTSIWALGTKDWSTGVNYFDASDNNQEVLLTNWPVKSFFMPDGIANYTVNGATYLVTANEGDEKEYNTLNERVAVNSTAYRLDSVKFPHASFLKKDYNLGRLRVTNLNGDTDNDGDFDEIYMVGARSFSIFNTSTKAVVYDNAGEFELITSQDTAFKTLFNVDNGGNGLKNRSRAKGPEPEGVVLANIKDRHFAFIGLERIGGVMVYEITNPAKPTFVDYKNTRTKSAFGGDNGPEGLIYIPQNHTVDNKAYVIVANEVSGTLAIFEVIDNIIPNSTVSLTVTNELIIFPNPANGAEVFFSEAISFQLMDLQGRVILSANNIDKLDISKLAKGTYIIHTNDGRNQKLVVE